MLSSISPVGERGRSQPWSVTVAAYLIGSVAGGTLMGVLTGGLGQLTLSGTSTSTRLVALSVLAAVGVVLDATVGVPTRHRQVDERWLTTYRGWVYGGGYGLQLGTGVVTIIPSSVVWVLWLGTVLTADVVAGALVGATFGALRALPLLAAGRIRTLGALRRTLAWVDRVRPTANRAVTALQGVLAVVVLVAVL